MELKLSSYHPSRFVKQIASHLEVKSRTDCLEEILDLPESYGQGSIIGFNFSDGVGLILFDCQLNEDWLISLKEGIPQYLQFNISIEGGIKHYFNNNNVQYFLNPLQSTITANQAKYKQGIQIPGKTKLVFACLTIDRKKYKPMVDQLAEKIPPKLRSLFYDLDAEQTFFYQGNYSITCSECIQEIKTDQNEGIVRSTLLEGITLQLLSYQVKQYIDDQNSPGKQLALRKQDVDKILEAKDIMLAKISEDPTIESLAKLVGINQTKLKSGFKRIFNMPIKAWLRDKRMENAKLLLLQGELSIRDIAERIGYTNKSHFSRQFKKKFGVLPKDYAQSIKVKIKGHLDNGNQNDVHSPVKN